MIIAPLLCSCPHSLSPDFFEAPNFSEAFRLSTDAPDGQSDYVD